MTAFAADVNVIFQLQEIFQYHSKIWSLQFERLWSWHYCNSIRLNCIKHLMFNFGFAQIDKMAITILNMANISPIF